MEYSPGDFLDRYSILWIKAKKGLSVSDEIEFMDSEFNYYTLDKDVLTAYQNLLASNQEQYDCEDFLRTTTDMSEAGKIALKIRIFNTNRVNLKNTINKLCSYRFMEKKKYKSI